MNKATTLATVLALFAAANAQSNPWRQVKFPSHLNNYTLDYQVQTGNTSVRYNLSATAINTTAWVSNKSGVYFGLGFGNNLMSNVDSVDCMFVWKNASTDAFACYDLYFDANRAASANETQDVSSVTTVTKDKATGAFKVSFVRPLAPSDIAKGTDYNVSLTADTKFIWALGQLDSSLNPVQHAEGFNGAYQINLATGNSTWISDEPETVNTNTGSTSFGSYFSAAKLFSVAVVAIFSMLA